VHDPCKSCIGCITLVHGSCKSKLDLHRSGNSCIGHLTHASVITLVHRSRKSCISRSLAHALQTVGLAWVHKRLASVMHSKIRQCYEPTQDLHVNALPCSGHALVLCTKRPMHDSSLHGPGSARQKGGKCNALVHRPHNTTCMADARPCMTDALVLFL
jgi:hypothetical protein